MNEQNKTSETKNLMFIFTYMKKYWLGLTFVILLLVLSSYFQVISPKIMSTSIDKMTNAVIIRNLNNSEEKALKGEKITDANSKNILLQTLQLDDTASTEQIKEAVESKTALKEAFYNFDNEKNISVISGRGLTQEQKELVQKADIDQEIKDQLLGNVTNSQIAQIKTAMVDQIVESQGVNKLPEEQQTAAKEAIASQISDDQVKAQAEESINKNINLVIQKQYVLSKLGGYSEAEIKQVISSENKDEIAHLFNVVGYRNYIMNLDPDSINNEVGFSKEQNKYMENNLKTEEASFEGVYTVNREDAQSIKEISNKDLKNLLSVSQMVGKINNTMDNAVSEFKNSMWLLFVSYVLTMLSMFLYNILMASVASRSTGDMRNSLFSKIEQLPIRFFDQSNDGDLLSRFINDIDNIATFLNQTLVQVISQFTTLIGIIIMMYKEDKSIVKVNLFGGEHTITHVLLWTMIAYASVALFIAYFVIKKAQQYVGLQQEKLGDLNGFIDERISGQKVIVTYGLEDETVEGFEAFNDDYKEKSIKGQIYSGVLMPLMQGIGLLNLATLIFMSATFVSKGVMTVGVLTAFIQYSQRFFNPLAQMLSQYNLVELAITGAGRVKEVMDQKSEIVEGKDAVEITSVKGNVDFVNVDFEYNKGVPILRDINLQVKEGKMIALVGPTGSGKTTVMNLMNRFYDVTGGEIKLDGRPIKEITIESLRKNVGIVLQDSILFSGTVRDNIAYGKDNATDEEVINAAKTANIHDFIMTLENGYDTHVDNNTSAFSVGQKQLMSIARTIITNPGLLILDEATSNVDTVTEAKIQKAMENVLEGRTSFVIAHRLKTILNADEIIVLKDGQIIEQGNHEKLLKEDGFYAELYKNQFVLD